MSQIPAGLTGGAMRVHMEDKGAISSAGGIYVGTANATTTCLSLGGAGLPLVSNGSTLNYSTLSSSGFQDAAITKAKVGVGGIVAKNVENWPEPWTLEVRVNGDDIDIYFE